MINANPAASARMRKIETDRWTVRGRADPPVFLCARREKGFSSVDMTFVSGESLRAPQPATSFPLNTKYTAPMMQRAAHR